MPSFVFDIPGLRDCARKRTSITRSTRGRPQLRDEHVRRHPLVADRPQRRHRSNLADAARGVTLPFSAARLYHVRMISLITRLSAIVAFVVLGIVWASERAETLALVWVASFVLVALVAIWSDLKRALASDAERPVGGTARAVAEP